VVADLFRRASSRSSSLRADPNLSRSDHRHDDRSYTLEIVPAAFAPASYYWGHSKLESTVRYLGIEVDDALLLSEQTDL
jgi:hypothetical protein